MGSSKPREPLIRESPIQQSPTLMLLEQEVHPRERIELFSLNVNGLNGPSKRRRTFSQLQKLKLDIICLQETHIKKQHSKLLGCPKLGKLFISSASQKKRGLALYIKEKLDPKYILADEDGRILMVEVTVKFKKVLLVAIYAPNDHQEMFYQKLHTLLLQLEYQTLCLMGDFSAIVDKKMDHKSETKEKKGRRILPKSCFNIIEEFRLTDVWRHKNPTSAKYTFYSNRHRSWTRIDMIWITPDLVPDLLEAEIETNVWVDHNPVTMTLKGAVKTPRWVLNKALLKDKKFKEETNKEMEIFFQINKTEETCLQNVWDTAKAYVRGLIITYSAKINKMRKHERSKLVEELMKLEQELQEDPSKKDLKTQMNILKHRLNLLDTNELTKQMKLTKQNFFENANKPGRWLAYKVKKEREKRLIYKLKDGEGRLQVQSTQIKKIVEDFFAKLYQNKEISIEKVNEYIRKGKLPKIPEKYRKALNEEVTMTEITEAIKRQKNDKTPGPDGLPAEFYKTFEGILSMPLKDICNAALLDAKIPNTWKEANITLIPKEDTDLTQIQNYRPISLLNVDYRIFASVMAERLKKYLTDFIHPDQNGFLPKRQMRNNMRIILDILEYYEVHSEKSMVLLFMDAQKAFDNVNWQFMKQQLVQMEFGEKFINAILSIYQKQSARIIINGECTNTIDIQKGTRQGCPLSPLLFILILEVLNRNIRDDMDIKGTRIRDESYKLQAFADDLIFIIEEPLVTMSKLLQRIEEYGDVTGMKINRDKTKLLVKNLTLEQRKTLAEQVDLQIVKKVKYLGIFLTAKCTTLKEDNYDKLFKEIKSDLEKWANLQLSLLGRIALVKMNILPKLLFLFQMIPIKIDKKFFDDLNTHILRFIWKKKKPRIKLKMLQEAKGNGGFGLPDWMLYYQASVLTWLKEWITLRNKRILYLEGHDLQMGWHAYMWYEKCKVHGCFLNHFIRKSLMSVWEKLKIKLYTKLPRWLSPMEALVYPNTLNFDTIVRYDDILDNDGGLKLNQEIQEQGINISWWHKVQMQSRYAKDYRMWGFYKEPTAFDHVILKSDEKMIKRLYNFLLDRRMEDEQVKETMITWAQNFGYNIELEKWQKLWKRNIKITLATSYKENLYKMFYRWYLSPNRLAKMYPNMSNRCWKCKHKSGTFYHMWWTCDKAKKYWIKIHKWLEEMLQKPLTFKPEVFLLGIVPDDLSKQAMYLTLHVTTAARIAFAQHWKSEEPPTDELILKKILDCAEMDRLTLSLKEKEDTDFYQTWDSFYHWLEKRDYA
ncbi:hypothetical protein EYD10_09237 [Varanus komodoensis]|nr:hypothetical protein EYD10_09237 [Varanus komodoensis]